MIWVKTVPGLLVVCAGFAIPMQTASAAPFETYVTEAATRANIPPAWITAVMRAESQGDVRAHHPRVRWASCRSCRTHGGSFARR
ncbi:hypothetical protein MSKU15_1918 [Komagataeibacter diospyri]|nr:hypothetical protein MSKU15_1918 [Komagataeibacter diospyri]